MVPTKVPKQALKSIDKGIIKSKKNNNKKYTSFSIYLFKLLRSLDKGNNLRISKHSMTIMNNLVSDMTEKILAEAVRLVCYVKKNTLTTREIQTAIRLLITGELAEHANIEGLKAIKLYRNSQEVGLKVGLETI